MNSKKLAFLLVVALAMLAVAGTKVSQLTRTRSLQDTSRFLVSTQDATSGRWSSRFITAPDLATNLGPWITNSGTASGGSATNAQPPSTVLSNLTSTGVAPGATNASAYVGSSGGKGTNLLSYGVTNIGAFSNSANAYIGGTAYGTEFQSPLFTVFAGGDLILQSGVNMTFAGAGVNEAAYFTAGKQLATVSGVSPTEMGYLDGVTSSIQTQINALGGTGGVTNGIPSYANRIVFWDDFDGAGQLTASQFLQRRSPSGHSYYLNDNGNGGFGTNGFRMTNGYIKQFQTESAPFYLSVSNNASSNLKPWNLQGVAFRWRSNNTFAAPFDIGSAMVRATHATLSSSATDFLHSYTQVDSSVLYQRGLIENLYIGGSSTAFNAQTSDLIIWETATFSNTVVISMNGWVQSFYYTNLAFANYPVHMWELLGSVTNSHTPEILSIWSGYASPALEFIANTSQKLGTNGLPMVQLSSPTLVNGSYTNTTFDVIVGIPNGTTRTNRLPVIGNDFGRLITVYDKGITATGTNVWVAGSNPINGGPTQTNITINGGSISLRSTPEGWIVESRFDVDNNSGGSGGGPGSFAANANQFDTNNVFSFNSGALVTNLQARGLTPLGLTASRATFIDASGNLTNVTSASASTDYVHADGSVGTPGSSSPGGVTANLQVNNGGSFVGSTNAYFNVTNGFLGIGVAAPGFELVVSNNAGAQIQVKSGTAVNNIGPSSIGTVTDTAFSLSANNGLRWKVGTSSEGYAFYPVARYDVAQASIPAKNIYLQNNVYYPTNPATMTNASLTWDWGGPSRGKRFLSGPSSDSFTNAPVPGTDIGWKDYVLEIVDTGIAGSSWSAVTVAPAAQQINWQTVDGLPFIQSNATNIITLRFDGTNTLGYCSFGLVNSFAPGTYTGVGGALTNFTLLSTTPEAEINGFTNVSIRASMNYGATRVDYWNLTITNYSGTDRTLEFSIVTNRWVFSGTYGTNAPNTITNGTGILISGRQKGTNVMVGYSYFAGPR